MSRTAFYCRCGARLAGAERYAHRCTSCSRCTKVIRNFVPPGEGMTSGYYVAAAWSKYANPGEVYICDACMWSDPRYIATYGRQPAGGPT